MPYIHRARLAYERHHWLRADAYQFLRSDWRRHVSPGSELAALYSEIKRKYRPDQLRVPSGTPEGGQWTDGSSLGGHPAGSSGSTRVAGQVIPICIVGAKAVFGDGTWKVVYVCADGREIVRTGTGRIPGLIIQP